MFVSPFLLITFAIQYLPLLKIFDATQPSAEMPSHGLDYENTLLISSLSDPRHQASRAFAVSFA